MQRRTPKVHEEEAALTDGIVRLAKQYGRYGDRSIRETLIAEGWRVSVKRDYRIWRAASASWPSSTISRASV
jgi:putative transposase